MPPTAPAAPVTRIGLSCLRFVVMSLTLGYFKRRLATRRSMVGASRSATLPDTLAPLARLEPYGMMILIGVLFILPLLGAQLGIDLNIVWHLVQRATNLIIGAILWLTGNAILGETAQY